MAHPGREVGVQKLPFITRFMTAPQSSRRGIGARARRLGLGLCATWLSLACGVQGPPVPPRVEQPQAVQNLAITQIGKTLEFSFTPPALAADGERLTKPLEVEIFRAVTLAPAAQNSSGPTEPFTPWLSLSASDLGRHKRGEGVVFSAPLSEADFGRLRGTTLTFALRSLTRGFRRRPVESALSNVVYVRLVDVGKPVGELRATAREKGIQLTWSVSATEAGDASRIRPTAYRVYRSRSGGPGTFQALGETTSPEYSDPAFEFNQTYFYKVRAIFKSPGQTAESEDSAVVGITPRDIFPPAAPAGLSAIYTAQGVELIWTAGSEADLAGYHAYRRRGEGAFERVTQEILPTPVFRDSSVPPDQTYVYRVTAVDLAGNESGPSEEASIETQ